MPPPQLAESQLAESQPAENKLAEFTTGRNHNWPKTHRKF